MASGSRSGCVQRDICRAANQEDGLEVEPAHAAAAPGTKSIDPALIGQVVLTLASGFAAEWSNPEQPMVKVTWQEAKTYFESWAKGRLPTEAEWSTPPGQHQGGYGQLDAIAWCGQQRESTPGFGPRMKRHCREGLE